MLTNAKADVAEGLPAKARFQFSQDVDLGNLLEFVVNAGWRTKT
jgi:hypothetical protein